MKAFDSAWRLLKYDDDDDDDLYDDEFYYDYKGDPRDPRKNPAFDEEDFILDDMDDAILEHEIRQLRQSPGFYDKPEPAVTEEERKEEELKQHIADYLESQKLASQPMDLAWRMLKANPSWMRTDANKGRIHTDPLPNPFDPNYQEQLIEEEQRRNAEDEAIERYNELFRQRAFTALENKVYDRLNNQTVGIDKIPTTQKYGQASGDVRRDYRIQRPLPWGYY